MPELHNAYRNPSVGAFCINIHTHEMRAAHPCDGVRGCEMLGLDKQPVANGWTTGFWSRDRLEVFFPRPDSTHDAMMDAVLTTFGDRESFLLWLREQCLAFDHNLHLPGCALPSVVKGDLCSETSLISNRVTSVGRLLCRGVSVSLPKLEQAEVVAAPSALRVRLPQLVSTEFVSANTAASVDLRKLERAAWLHLAKVRELCLPKLRHVDALQADSVSVVDLPELQTAKSLSFSAALFVDLPALTSVRSLSVLSAFAMRAESLQEAGYLFADKLRMFQHHPDLKIDNLPANFFARLV
jgi:hypothetical protein